ncbi:hypothetical protein G9A89_013820, partial [Geosiphon pyriformis]
MALSVLSGAGLFLSTKSLVITSDLLDDSGLSNHMAFLEHSLELLSDQISEILRKLSFVNLVLMSLSSYVSLSFVTPPLNSALNSDMAVDNMVVPSSPILSVINDATPDLSLSSSKMLTTKVGGLESKMMALEDIVHWHKNMDNLILIITETKLWSKVCLWIADRFDSICVFTSDTDFSNLDSGIVIIMNIFLAHHVCKISEVLGRLLSIRLLFKSKLSVLILGLYVGASLSVRFSQAGKINSMIAKAVNESFFVVLGDNFNENGSHKCASFKKCLDLGLVNFLSRSSFVKTSTWTNSYGVAKTIDFLFVSSNLVNVVMDHNVCDAVSVSVSLGGLLDMQLNSLCKQFKRFDNIFTKESSRFHKLELLVSRIVKAFREESVVNFDSLIKCWNIVDSDTTPDRICFVFFGAKRSYCTSKLAKSLRTKEINIKTAIDKRMESFKVNKGHIIRSMLKCSFCKVVLNHLVFDDKLILDPNLVKSKIDYVFNKAFSSVMCSIKFDELFEVVFFLSNGKATSLSSISNELWKHCNKMVLDMFLVLLNSCLSGESVPKNILTNTQPIALIETACKILSKILSNRISSTCSNFNVLCGDNFLVLKDITTQFPIFVIGLVVKDTLEKNQELWLVLQNMQKAYDSVFLLLLWHIFYDPLLCEIKCQESVCGYRLNSHFVFRSGCTKSQTGLSSFFAAGTFIDDTIWIGSSQAATQHILDIASEFFRINDISINNDKTMAIPINSRVSNSFLSINGSPISIAKKNKSYQYLGIFLLTKGLSKPSLAKTNSDVHFFTNLVLKKAVLDKQLLYLVLAVFYLIVSYKMQFSFVPVGMCNKWDALIYKGLKLKSGLPLDFSSNTIYYPFFYGLKFHDLQILCWCLVHLLSFLICIHVSASDNFLVDMVHVFLDCNLFLSGFLANFFWFCGEVSMSAVLGNSVFNWHIFKCWKRLDSCGLVPEWFRLFVVFFNGESFSLTHLSVLNSVASLNILKSHDFVSVCDHFLQVGTDSLLVYTDGSLSNLGIVGCRAGTATFFEDIDLGLGIGTIALALECVLLLSSVKLFSDSQSALDVCRLELDLVCPDFCNWCWIKCHHIVNIKNHSGVLENEHADIITGDTSLSNECFIMADGSVVSGNSKHFVHDICYSVCHVCWKLLESYVDFWKVVSGFSYSSLGILQLLSSCVSDFSLSMALYKDFVFNGWLHKVVTVFPNLKIAGLEIVKFVCFLSLAFRSDIWSVCAKHHVYMEKNGLILLDGLVFISVSGLASGLSAGIVKLLGIVNAFGVYFGFCKF